MTRCRPLLHLAAATMAAAASLFAQPSEAPLASWRGDFRFAYLAYSEGEKLAAVTQGGTLSFDGAGQARFGEAAGSYTALSAYEATLTLDGAVLELHRNPGTGLIAGSAAQPGLRHHLLIAVRAAEGLSTAILRGNYGAAYLAIRNSAAPGLVTAFAQFSADGDGKFSRFTLTGHAASIDDVVRREERPEAAFELAADGTGLARFGAGSDSINGDLRLAASPDGGVVLGWSAGAAHPALMIAIRKNPESAVFSFRGRYWIAEAAAENSFVYQQSTRWFSAAGSMASGANGHAFFSQRLRTNAEVTHVTTSNQYRVGTDGRHSLAPKLGGVDAPDNFAFNESAFVSAQVGVPGQLSLNHGLLVGIAQPPGLLRIVNAAAPSYTESPLSPGALLSIAGPGFAIAAAETVPATASEWPTELGGVRVRINGIDAPLASVTPDIIQFQCPARLDGSGPATVEVLIKGEVTHTLRAAARAASSPGVFTPDGNGTGAAQATHADGSPVTAMKPAEPGESITLTATGLGAMVGAELESGKARKVAAGTLRVLLNGEPAEVQTAGPAAGQLGRYQIVVTIPRDLDIGAGGLREIPVALVTTDSFTDLTDLVVIRRQ